MRLEDKGHKLLNDPPRTQKWRHNALRQRCVNVVDNLGFPQICMDNQHLFVDKTML
jgi:hypothetical protein